MLNDNSFQNLSDSVIEVAEEATQRMLKKIKSIAKRLSRGGGINTRKEREAVEKMWQDFYDNSKVWTDENLPKAYLRGIKQAESTAKGSPTPGAFQFTPLFGTGGGGTVSSQAREILGQYRPHLTMYSVFQDSAYNQFSQTRIPVVRTVMGDIRELIILSSESQYAQADTFTRLQFSQDLMTQFADNNITGIRYSDGRTINLDSYSEVVARSQTGNAARQASLNRLQEYGVDLVQISQHYPTSDLCAPWQGRVYSISGTDSKFPPLQDAISGGLYHPNCKHYQAGYIEGVSELPDPKLSHSKNQQQYEIERRQRAIERKIRKYKRRKAAALTEDAERKAQQFISKWQKKQRELVDKHSFLRRKYYREQI